MGDVLVVNKAYRMSEVPQIPAVRTQLEQRCLKKIRK